MTPIARIDYLFGSGKIGESLYFFGETDFLKQFKGSPLGEPTAGIRGRGEADFRENR